METFFQANDIKDNGKKRAVLLSSIGSRTYSVLRNLTAPAAPIEKDLRDLQTLLKDHYAPHPNPIVQRCRFYARNRQPGERLAVYLSDLRALADQCEFEGYLEIALRDRLIAGIADIRFQRRLPQEPYKDLTLAKAVDIAVAMETASKNVMTMQETQHWSPTVSVYSVPQQRSHKGLKRDVIKPHSYPSWKDQQCWRCGRSTHVAADCKFKTAKCHRCGLKGHIERKWQTNRDGKLQQCEIQPEQRVQQVDTLADDMVDYFDEAVCICTITEQQMTVVKKMDGQCCIVSPFTRDVTVYGERIGMEVDSGSRVTVLNSATFDALKKRQPSLSLSKPEIDLQIYTGSHIKVMGQIMLPVSY